MMMITRMVRILLLSYLAIILSSCVTPPPRDVNNLCNIFHQYPSWRRDAEDAARRWRVPVHVQMAIMHQESKFDANATPPRTTLLWFIPWSRPSSAHGYTQALTATWAEYKRNSRGIWASREDFTDAVDFIGWYANQAYLKARVPREDAYALYLAYHEGIGGYQRQTYRRKPWLMTVAKKVDVRSKIYQTQLQK